MFCLLPAETPTDTDGFLSLTTNNPNYYRKQNVKDPLHCKHRVRAFTPVTGPSHSPPPTPSLSHRPLHVTTHLSGPGLPPPPSRACLPLRWGPPARRRVSGDVLQGLSLQSCGREGQKQGFRLLTEPRHNTKLQHHFCKEGSRSRNQDLPVGTTAVSAT